MRSQRPPGKQCRLLAAPRIGADGIAFVQGPESNPGDYATFRGSLIDHEYSIAVRAFLLLHILHRKMEASQIATPGRTLHTKPKAWRPSSVPI